MKRNAFILIAAAGLAVGALGAQEPSRGPDGGTTFFVAGVELLAIPDKPFTAQSSIEWTRTLGDGNTVTTHVVVALARDGSGRMYRERRFFVPANSERKAPLTEIHVYDPVSRSQFVCVMRTQKCMISNYAPRLSFETRPAGPSADGKSTLARENLGQDTLEGISVTGTRETTTLSPGVRGNERQLEFTREFWYSEELQTNLSVTRIDPLDGKQVIRLFEITRGEPDSHLFEIPTGFTVSDTRAPVSH